MDNVRFMDYSNMRKFNSLIKYGLTLPTAAAVFKY
jgi:hypothetical protein